MAGFQEYDLMERYKKTLLELPVEIMLGIRAEVGLILAKRKNWNGWP